VETAYTPAVPAASTEAGAGEQLQRAWDSRTDRPGKRRKHPPADHHPEPMKEVVGGVEHPAALEWQGLEDALQPPATPPAAGAVQPW
jgi:hypothetical protein